MSSDVKAPAAPQVTIVIPVYNEESILYAAVVELIEKLKTFQTSYEILLSENGSKDRTREIGHSLEREYPQVRLLTSDEPNYGKALRAGIEDARGRFVVCDEIDICDTGFHKRALEALTFDQADMVVGSKLHRESKDKRPMSRHAATMIITGMLRVLVGFKRTDTHGLKAFNKDRVLPVVKRCIVDKDLFASELVIRAERMELRVLELPVDLEEKRVTSIKLVKRVPNVLKNLAKLFWAIRIKG
jgi:glycosyltransferase involved in cell wall biosynthesis